MGNKREQRIRRKARAQVRAVQRSAASELKQLGDLKSIALVAIRYVGAIDAPNPHEPWDIAKRRDELVDVVHAHQGRPERTRRDAQVVRPRPAPVGVKPAERPVSRFPTQPLPRRTESRHAVLHDARAREQLERDLEIKRRLLRDAAAKYGAEMNKQSRNPTRVAELRWELDVAARTFARAECTLADAQLGARTIGVAS